jgi:hypothetical protein
MSHKSGRLLLIPFPCWRPHLRGPGGGFCPDGSPRSWGSMARRCRVSPRICPFETGIRRGSSRCDRDESPPWTTSTVLIPQEKSAGQPAILTGGARWNRTTELGIIRETVTRFMTSHDAGIYPLSRCFVIPQSASEGLVGCHSCPRSRRNRGAAFPRLDEREADCPSPSARSVATSRPSRAEDICLASCIPIWNFIQTGCAGSGNVTPTASVSRP